MSDKEKTIHDDPPIVEPTPSTEIFTLNNKKGAKATMEKDTKEKQDEEIKSLDPTPVSEIFTLDPKKQKKSEED